MSVWKQNKRYVLNHRRLFVKLNRKGPDRIPYPYGSLMIILSFYLKDNSVWCLVLTRVLSLVGRKLLKTVFQKLVVCDSYRSVICVL